MAEPSIQKHGVTVKIRNDSGHTISLVSIRRWIRPNLEDPFLTIMNGDVGEITVDALEAALVFNIEHVDGISWVHVWNYIPIGAMAKVFTDFVKQPVPWEHIRKENNDLGTLDYEIVKSHYKAGIKFESNPTSSPIIYTYIEKIILRD